MYGSSGDESKISSRVQVRNVINVGLWRRVLAQLANRREVSVGGLKETGCPDSKVSRDARDRF